MDKLRTTKFYKKFIDRVVWQNSPISTSDGILATYWTLHHAIETNTGGVSDPKQIIVLDNSGTISTLSEAELEETKESIASLEEYIGQYGNTPADDTLPT